jgi:hypothetical protein
VIPPKAGIQLFACHSGETISPPMQKLDSGLRRNDDQKTLRATQASFFPDKNGFLLG